MQTQAHRYAFENPLATERECTRHRRVCWPGCRPLRPPPQPEHHLAAHAFGTSASSDGGFWKTQDRRVNDYLGDTQRHQP